MCAKKMTKSTKKTNAKLSVTSKKREVTAIEAKAQKAKSAGTKSNAKPKRISALDAAAQILRSAGKPMRASELIAAMAVKGLWSSPKGKTPEATLSAAINREIKAKGADARFVKTDRGLFALN